MSEIRHLFLIMSDSSLRIVPSKTSDTTQPEGSSPEQNEPDRDELAELRRLLDLHRLYLTKSLPEELIPVSEDITRELQTIVRQTGHYQGEITGSYDEVTKKALWDLYGIENLEERWHNTLIDRVALEFLRQRFLKN